jgi:hypothetical protein
MSERKSIEDQADQTPNNCRWQAVCDKDRSDSSVPPDREVGGDRCRRVCSSRRISFRITVSRSEQTRTGGYCHKTATRGPAEP